MLPGESTTGLGCIPEGRTVSYKCTITDSSGSGSSIWEGSAFNCSKKMNRIVLLHENFPLESDCGALLVTSVGVNGCRYTSQLNLTATADLNGANVICRLSGMNPGPEKFNDTLSVGGMYT